MSKTFLKIGLGLALALGLAGAGSAAVTVPTKQLSGHVPKVVSSLTSTGRMPSTNMIHLAITLPLQNQQGMDNLLAQINDPASPNYHHYLSSKDFTDHFGPSEQDYQSVIDFAKASGFSIFKLHTNRMMVEVDARVADVEKAFNVKLKTYQHPAKNQTFFAPDVEPTLPASLPIVEIGGLHSFNLVRPKYKVHPIDKTAAKSGNSAVTKYQNGSGQQGTYLGNDFRPAFVPGTTLTGSGQKVALFEYDGYLSNDITMYEQSSGLPAVSLTNVLLQGFSGVPQDPNAQGEVTLDIDMVIAMAPGVSEVVVYEGNFAVAYLPNVVLNQIAEDDSASQVSSSWGWYGGPSTTTDQIFKQMDLQGQTYFNANGDEDAFVPAGPSGNAPGSIDDPNLPHAPEDCPYITEVAATKLATTGPGGSYVTEQVWNYGPEYGEDGVGSSSGISGYYAIPSWQKGINMTTNQGSTTWRNTSDVAMPGEDIEIIVNGAVEAGVAGTSCAAPLWAGFMALVNQQAALNGAAPGGFINPAIYALGKSAGYTNYFHDITTGNNTWSQSPNLFYTFPGYDLASGWGSPNGTNLIKALAGTNSGITTPVPVVISAPLPPWGNTLSVANGSNPNGAWFLFLQDDAPLNVGLINNGWSLALSAGASLGTPADKQISAPANMLMAYKGGTNIVIAVTNYGPVTATNVVVTDTLPGTGLTLLSVTPTNGVTYLGSSFQWSVGMLLTNQGAAITVSFTNSAYGFFTNSPSVTANTYDPNPADKFADTVFAVPSVAPQLGAALSGTGNGAHFNLSITNVTGLTAVIQATTNLLSPNGWVNVYTSTTPFATNIDVLTNFPARFYRAVLQ